MIEIKIVSDEKILCDICRKCGFKKSGSTFAMAAFCGTEIIGSSVFTVTKDGMTLERVDPENDVMLADGMIRSTLHIADNRGMSEVFYSDGISTELLRKLDFIKDPEKKLLKLDKLTESCCCKK